MVLSNSGPCTVQYRLARQDRSIVNDYGSKQQFYLMELRSTGGTPQEGLHAQYCKQGQNPRLWKSQAL